MTQIPADQGFPAGATQTVPGSRRLSKKALVDRLTGFGLRVFPRIPIGIKRLLLGGRSITVDGNTLDTTVQLLLSAQRLTGGSGVVLGDDVASVRAQLENLATAFRQDIAVGAVSDLTIPGPAGVIAVRHYTPAQPGGPLLVFYHGGGQVLGNLDSHDDLCRVFCRYGELHVLSVDYRLAPEHKAPAGSDDAFAAFQWALDHAAELGADTSRVAVGGDSAGGNLAALVAQRARNEGIPLPVLQVLIYPVVDYAHQTRSQTLFANGYFLTKRDIDWFSDKYLTGAAVDAADPRVSPLLADDLSGLPPALVVTAGFDPLRDEGDRYAEAMRAAGVIVDHRQFGTLVHGFLNFFPFGGDSRTATAEVISALRAHLSRG